MWIDTLSLLCTQLERKYKIFTHTGEPADPRGARRIQPNDGWRGR